MDFTARTLQILCEQAREAALAAAELIAGTSPDKLEVERKAGAVSLASEVVSQLDRDAESLILDRLADSVERYNLGVLAEESEHGQTRFEKPAFWCVDPLDGTLPFLEGRPGYAVSIALVDHAGIPWLGVVVDPISGDVFQALRNTGATLNGRVLRTLPKGGELNVFTDRSMAAHPLFEPCLQAWGPTRVHPAAGAVMNVCQMLCQSPGAYFKFPKVEAGGGSLWDYAATACLTCEAGGVVSDLFGAPLDLNRKDSTFMNHRGFLYATDALLHQQLGNELRRQWGR